MTTLWKKAEARSDDETRLTQLNELALLRGPTPADDGPLLDLIEDAWKRERRGDPELKDRVRRGLAPVYRTSTLIGHAYSKPMGHAGDWHLVERIHERDHANNPVQLGWDRFFHAQPVARAIRARRNVLSRVLSECLRSQEGQVRVLNVGSGSGSDLVWALESLDQERLAIDCLDLDDRAHERARRKTRHLGARLRFLDARDLEAEGDMQYDLVWSAGLFDSFDDQLFEVALTRMLAWKRDGGRLVIGNFQAGNPSRPAMEVALDWNLVHRSRGDLMALAIGAGVDAQAASVFADSTGVSLFLDVI